MAQKTVCDVCGADVGKADTDEFQFGKLTLRMGAQVKTRDDFVPIDLCRRCRADAASVTDDRAKEAQAIEGTEEQSQ